MVATLRPDVTLWPEARRTAIEIVYAGRDVTADLAPHLKRLTWSESLSGAADDLQIEIHDRERLWATDWRPTFGDVIAAAVEAESWVSGGATRRLPLGRVLVDEIEVQGPPATATIKAISAGLSTGLRRTKRTRGWAGAKLSTIATDIASRAGLDLLYSGPDFAIARQDQKHESDLAFLLRLCEETGLALKVTDGQIAVIAEADLEAGTPVTTLVPGLSRVKSWSLRDSSSERYVSCVVRYRDPVKGHVIEAIAGETHREDGRDVPDEPCLRETRRVEDKAHAERLARQILRAAQQGATLASFSVVGDPALVSGVVVEVDGVYGMGGRYLVTDTQHSAVGGYTTSLELRRILGAA